MALRVLTQIQGKQKQPGAFVSKVLSPSPKMSWMCRSHGSHYPVSGREQKCDLCWDPASEHSTSAQKHFFFLFEKFFSLKFHSKSVPLDISVMF